MKTMRVCLIYKQNFHFEKNVLLFESYFRNGQRGKYMYEVRAYFQEFREKPPGVAVLEAIFLRRLLM